MPENARLRVHLGEGGSFESPNVAIPTGTSTVAAPSALQRGQAGILQTPDLLPAILQCAGVRAAGPAKEVEAQRVREVSPPPRYSKRKDLTNQPGYIAPLLHGHQRGTTALAVTLTLIPTLARSSPPTTV